MPERHRTLRATIAWSIDALKPEERELLTAMSILPAPASYDLIDALAGPDLDTFTLLDSLVEKSLVRTVDAGTETRYGLLVSIRDYAAEALTDPERRRMPRPARRPPRPAASACAWRNRKCDTSDEVEAAQRQFVAREFDQLRAAIAHRQRPSGRPRTL